MNSQLDKILNANIDRLDTRKAAEMIGVSPTTLSIWRCTKKENIPYYKVGGKVYYKNQDIHDWLESKRVTS